MLDVALAPRPLRPSAFASARTTLLPRLVAAFGPALALARALGTLGAGAARACAPAALPLALALVAWLAPDLAFAAEGGGHGEHHGAEHALPPVWLTSFFVVMLLCIAILPLTSLGHWWEHNSNKLIVSLALAAVPLLWLLVLSPSEHHVHQLEETAHEYISFIVLLGTLFYVTGGIHLKGDIQATPAVNTGFLLFGTLIASLVGTTGASMLLIRPVLRTNMERKYKVHVVVFFIFLVSNVGGSLLPIGDPPLFLGYLQGVPFLWTMNLLPHWALVSALLLVTFFFLDQHFYNREDRASLRLDRSQIEPLKLEGGLNTIWLVGIVLCVALIKDADFGIFVRELAMIACAVASGLMTSKAIREANKFTWFPIVEVAALFIGIFLTMIPALMILKAQGGSLGVDTPVKFFWIAGGLSSFLDNAPTYLVFFNTAKGMVEQGALAPTDLVADTGVPTAVLLAISAGSVFMGANTYIGNGPNFMVKAIAEEQGVEMPSFFGYMRWSVIFLIPCFLITTFVFFWF